MGWIRQQAETPVLIQPFLYSAYRSRQAVLAGNLLTDQIRPIYFKYLAAFGSVLISSIYGVVDAAMVGQYQGPTDKTAALAVVAPVWNIIYSLGLLTGIGGSVLFSTMRGQAAGNEKKFNEYFSAAVIGTVILAALTWVAVIFFDRQFLTLFGAEETLLPLAWEYLFPIKFVVPCFLFTQLMSAFLRNDGDPALATKSVLLGGGVWRSLDAGSRTGSQWIRPHLHNAHGQHPEHRPWYHPPVRYFVPAAALQHLLHLLLSGHDEALHRLCRVCEPRRCHQRHSHLPASGDCRSEQHLVRHAHHRAGSGGIYGGHNAALSEAADQVTAERIFRHIFPVP